MEETKRYIYDAWAELFAKIERNTVRFEEDAEARRPNRRPIEQA